MVYTGTAAPAPAGEHVERGTVVGDHAERAARAPEGPHTGAPVRIVASGGGLEWSQIQALLARDAHTPMGRERALALSPSRDAREISHSLGETAEARAALGPSGAPAWETIPDVRPTLDALRVPGAVAEGGELIALLPVLDAAGRLHAYGRGIAEVAPALAAGFRALPRDTELAELLRRSLDAEGAVTDAASAALRRVRQKIRDLRREIVKRMEAYFRAPDADTTFQEHYVTIRHGRYVLPVAAAAKQRVRGIVHDRSQSGATLFVEPEAMVEANNDLVQTTREEESEVLRVLAALSDAVRGRGPELSSLVEEMGRLDLVFARAALAERMDATLPAVGDARLAALRGARNPLLLAQAWREPGREVVPSDIEIGPERPLLVITGPNAGGKTVVLKTLALLVLMAQSGLHVPARPGARLPLVSQVFAIVGDDQSVAENLSTFSAFVKQLRVVLDEVDAHSLVLLDELGAGTDPDDGAALAQSVLEELATRGALTVASTHLEPLKAFASTHPKARNASVEFDSERLAPTFRLVYDRPGQSYALAIGARLGLPSELIERARALRSAQHHQLQELLARLGDRDRQEAERAALAERREAESAEALARAREELEAAERTARDTVARAKAESRRLVGDVRRAVNEEWDKLRAGEKSRAQLDRGRKRLREASRDVDATATEVAGSEASARRAEPGDRVEVAHLGLRGEIVAVDGGTATVMAGAITVKVPVQGLRSLGPAAAPAAPPRGAARDIRLPGRTVPGELHLIGRTSDEARDILEKYLDDAFLAGLSSVRIVHGKGTGTLRRTVEEVLGAHPLVIEHRPGAPREGGSGATVAAMGQD